VKQKSTPILEFADLRLTREKVTLLAGVSLTLHPGETCVLEGGNRSGKTSLLGALERRPARDVVLEGSVRFAGTEVLGLDDESYHSTFLHHIAVVPEDAGATLFPSQRVRALFPKSNARPPLELLAALGFAAPEVTLRQRVRELSQGARLAVSVGVALSRRPQLLIIDDIFHAGDAVRANQWWSEVAREQQERDLGVLVLCRSADTCTALHPARVVSLSNRRPLGPLRPLRVLGWGTEESAPPSARGAKPLLQVRHLTTVRSRDMGWVAKPAPVFALHSLDLSLERGEVVAIVGASPSGKSTLALTLARILEPSFGQVSVRTRAEPRQGSPPHRMLLCFEDARASFDPRLTLGQQLSEVLALRPAQPEEQELEVRVLGAVGLEPELLQRRPSEVSRAEVQLAAFARALLLDPGVLILDNALSNVEVPHQARLLGSLRDRCHARGLGALVVTHGLGSLEATSDRLGVMYAGHLVEIGPTREVVAQRHHPFTRILLDTQPRQQRRLQVVAEGSAPDLTRPPPGCMFHPRCPNAEAGRCDVEAPELLPIGADSGHRVACFHPHV
jgi:oligopeptide/dipeptide ABC transporter ATP-binding protein